MQKKIKFGIVGMGRIGSRHATCISQHPQAQLVGTHDVLPQYQSNCGKLRRDCSSFRDLIRRDLDVINICTPNYLHADMAIEALKGGRHVVIEKPIALHKIDAQSIISTAKEVDKLVFCVMQNRFSPTIIWLKSIISKGLLGEIKMLSIHCFWNRNENYYSNSSWHGSIKMDGGPLYTQFSHFIDVIYWLFGEINNISAEFFKLNSKNKWIEFEDSGIVRFNLSNGIGQGVLNYSTAIWDRNLESSITIIGEKGSVKIGGQYMDKIEYCHIKDYTLPHFETLIQCNDYGDYKGSASNHDKMINNVINVLLGTDKIHTNVIDGMQVVNIIETIYSSRI